MKIAAVQMTAELGHVEKNMAAAERLARQAFDRGAQMVILPEFFTSAAGFSPVMDQAARPLDGGPARMLKRLAAEHDGMVGGSFISRRGAHQYNTFILAFADGTIYTHDKDQPTMWENCYYMGGADDGVLNTPAGSIGVALCWEFVRARTARRLLGNVDLVVGGSCWWSLPDRWLPGFSPRVREQNMTIMRETPARFARLTGCPVVHAAHAGDFECRTPLLPGFAYRSHFLGETQITDGQGRILARMDRADGEGFVLADVEPGRKPPIEPIPDRFWIPDLPGAIRFAWWYQNLHGKWYYRRHQHRFASR
ncbi:MAG: carbon-nitrogen hydrolase family protein [Thermodesulfobacteriota bacterium]